ncbi:hypothetical protein Syun_003517 [Stephania yunnanensis]|uniref:PI3K/PI4K catalytic domain-containing protein n=1 Tax=Stephania yunnanensis TaxID=152371 RepID=A0AAP0L3W6_9MAGN
MFTQVILAPTNPEVRLPRSRHVTPCVMQDPFGLLSVSKEKTAKRISKKGDSSFAGSLVSGFLIDCGVRSGLLGFVVVFRVYDGRLIMARLLGLSRGELELPREITKTNLSSESGDSGWLIRFFDSAFFCEWIAVSYLYKHDHSGVRDYLCNRMYTLPLSGIESYLFQICYMMVHKPSPSLDKFVIDVCSKSLQIALKVQWFLMAELEDSDDDEGISRIQEKCQIAATLMGEWPPLIQPPNSASSPGSKNQVLNKLLSSKQRLLSLTSSPPPQRSLSSPSSGTGSKLLQEEGNKLTPDENKIFKKFIPGPKVRDALLFRKSVEKDDEDSEKDGFFKRLMRDSKDDEEEVLSSSSDGFFKKLFRDSKGDAEEKAVSKSTEYEEKEGFFRRLLKESKDDDEELISSSDGFFKRLFRDSKNDSEEKTCRKSVEDDEKEGFFRKFFKEKFEDKKDGIDRTNEEVKENVNGEEGESSDFPLFRRLFRVHPEDARTQVSNENGNCSGSIESSPGTENFFRKLFRDRDRSLEDSELFGSKKHKENEQREKASPKRPGSPKQKNDKAHVKPPLPNNTTSQLRKGTYHASLDFVQSLCDTSYGLVDVFPIEDRKSALRESLVEINSQIAAAQTSGGVCFPMGKGMYRVLNIPEDEAVLLNSREKAPYLICIEVLKGETPSHDKKDISNVQKLSKGGIPLANGDAQLPKPPPWAYPLWSLQDMHRNGSDKMSQYTSEAIDQAMLWENKMNFVHVTLALDKLVLEKLNGEASISDCSSQSDLSMVAPASLQTSVGSRSQDSVVRLTEQCDRDMEWVRVVLTADPGINMDEIANQEPPRRKDHRRVPSTIAIEEVKVGLKKPQLPTMPVSQWKRHAAAPTSAAAAKGEAPPGLPLKGAGQDSADAQPKIANGGIPKPTDPLSGELWEVKKERIRKTSIYGKSPGWDLRSAIVKSGDDCRQEHLAVQLVSHFYDIFQEAGLPLWLRPYEVLVTSSYTALIETIPNTASIHSIKKEFCGEYGWVFDIVLPIADLGSVANPVLPGSRPRKIQCHVWQWLKGGPPASSDFRLKIICCREQHTLCCCWSRQRLTSCVAVKDRHNGNLLIDEEGHIIHIDFGFMLSNSPGGVNFESAPFKLTRELLEVMDSDAEGAPSEYFYYFKVLCIHGFLTCRKHAERIILLVEMMQDSGYPCFRGGPRTIQNLRKRFHLNLTEEQCVSLVLSLISSSLDAWRTRQYDYYQRVLNGIL